MSHREKRKKSTGKKRQGKELLFYGKTYRKHEGFPQTCLSDKTREGE